MHFIGRKKIYVKRLKWAPPVLEVDFEPEDKLTWRFKEGQYLYLNCPFIDKRCAPVRRVACLVLQWSWE